MFPGKASIIQVIKTARTFWDRHPNQYIAIHCAYGVHFCQLDSLAACLQVYLHEVILCSTTII